MQWVESAQRAAQQQHGGAEAPRVTLGGARGDIAAALIGERNGVCPPPSSPPPILPSTTYSWGWGPALTSCPSPWACKIRGPPGPASSSPGAREKTLRRGRPRHPPESPEPFPGHGPSPGCHSLGWGDLARGSYCCKIPSGNQSRSTQQGKGPPGELGGGGGDGGPSTPLWLPPRFRRSTPTRPGAALAAAGNPPGFPLAPSSWHSSVGLSPGNGSSSKAGSSPPYTLPAGLLGCRVSNTAPPPNHSWRQPRAPSCHQCTWGPAGLSPPWGPVGAPDTCTQLEGNWGEAGWGGGGSGWVLGPGSRDTSLHTRSPCQSKRLLEIVPKGPPQHHLGRRDPGKGGVGGGLQQSGCTGELGGSHQTTTLNACKSPCIPPHPQIRAGGIWGDTGSAAASSPPGPIPYPPSTCSQAGLSHRVPPSTSRMAPRSPCWLSVAPTAAPWGAHPTLRGRVGHLGYVPT